jgi:hypothetical protein
VVVEAGVELSVGDRRAVDVGRERGVELPVGAAVPDAGVLVPLAFGGERAR